MGECKNDIKKIENNFCISHVMISFYLEKTIANYTLTHVYIN